MWIRDWVKSGGKLVIIGSSLECNNTGARYWEEPAERYIVGEGMYPISSKSTNFSCMYDDWWARVRDPHLLEDDIRCGYNNGEPVYGTITTPWGFSYAGPTGDYGTYQYLCQSGGEEVADQFYTNMYLKEFAEFIAFNPDEEEEEQKEFFKFYCGDNPASSIPDSACAIDGLINRWEFTGLDSSISCCQKTVDSEFTKDGLPFSVQTTDAWGVIPQTKNGGRRLVGSCDSSACTVVYKKNGLGAVIVMYDTTIFGAKATQLPIGWSEDRARAEGETLTPEELKLRDCNNDFWKFLCEEFLGQSAASADDTDEEPVFWDEYQKYYGDNQCVPTAACCLPGGECEDLNVWDCFKAEGIWYGIDDSNKGGLPAGLPLQLGMVDTVPNMDAGPGEQMFFEGFCNPTCDQLKYPCAEWPKGCCCKGVFRGYESSSFGDELVYAHECACLNTDLENTYSHFITEGLPNDTFYTGKSCDEICTTIPPECEEDEDCEGDFCCVDEQCGLCPCETDSDCPPTSDGTERCCSEQGNITEGYCVECPECDEDADCPGDQVCVNGKCRPQCSSDYDCPSGEICQAGRCVSGCRGDSDCPNGQVCENNICVDDDGDDDDDETTGPPPPPPTTDPPTTQPPECSSDEGCPGFNRCCNSGQCGECDCSTDGCCCNGDCLNCADEETCEECLAIAGCDICACISGGGGTDCIGDDYSE